MNITRIIKFHAGHCLKEKWLDEEKTIKNPCYYKHGHEYVLEATVSLREGEVKTEDIESGMVMNFGKLKSLMMKHVHDELDHKFIIDYKDPRTQNLRDNSEKDELVIMNWQPTAENLAIHIFTVLAANIPPECVLVKVKLWETSNCFVEYYGRKY